MGNPERIEAFLADALSAVLTRRMAERIVTDLRRHRRDAALPTDPAGLRALVEGDLARATFLRVGRRAARALAEVQRRLLAQSAIPVEAWSPPPVRIVYVGRSREAANALARTLGAEPVVGVDELHELLIALDTSERTLVVIDAADTALDASFIARFVPDFPAHVMTFVASATPAVRETYLQYGAAFRATLRSEPIDHPDLPDWARDVVRGVAGGTRRPRGGTSTTTEPARAA